MSLGQKSVWHKEIQYVQLRKITVELLVFQSLSASMQITGQQAGPTTESRLLCQRVLTSCSHSPPFGKRVRSPTLSHHLRLTVSAPAAPIRLSLSCGRGHPEFYCMRWQRCRLSRYQGAPADGPRSLSCQERNNFPPPGQGGWKFCHRLGFDSWQFEARAKKCCCAGNCKFCNFFIF